MKAMNTGPCTLWAVHALGLARFGPCTLWAVHANNINKQTIVWTLTRRDRNITLHLFNGGFYIFFSSLLLIDQLQSAKIRIQPACGG